MLDLERREQVLELYCGAQGWPFDISADLGAGMNGHKKGLRRLLDEIVAGDVGRLVRTHTDRLLRFGAELVFALCEARNVEVVIVNQHDHDANAAVNVKNMAMSSIATACGGNGAGPVREHGAEAGTQRQKLTKVASRRSRRTVRRYYAVTAYNCGQGYFG